jgi:inosine-uridine nucleoside N-ribohydrolase
MSDLRKVCVSWYEIAIRQNKAGNKVGVLPESRLQFVKLHPPSIFLYRNIVKILSAATAAGLLLAFSPSASAMTAVWIDTDLSIGSPFREVDDAYAVLLAFRSPELRIAGISSTYGNGSQAFARKATLDLVDRFGARAHLSARNVFAGAASARELGQPSAATQALVAALGRHPLTYMALGPLTNLATVLRLHPELAPRLREIIFVGSVSEPGPLHLGLVRVHDANVLKDPAAVNIVLQSAVPLRLVPIATAAHLALTSKNMQDFARSGTAGSYLSARSRTWLWFWNNFGGASGGIVFDALATIAAARPELIHFENAVAQLDSSGNLIAKPTRGGSGRIQISTAFRSEAEEWMIYRLSRKD